MSFVADLDNHIRTSRPEFASTLSEDGRTLRIVPDGHADTPDGPAFELHQLERAVILDWVWRLPVSEEREEELRDFVLAYVEDGVSNHGWQVPVVLEGGPLSGRRLTKAWKDLVGRLMFARKGREAGEPQRAELYKYLHRKSSEGEYVCVHQRSLEGEAVDAFIARGVNQTGPFVLIHDDEES